MATYSADSKAMTTFAASACYHCGSSVPANAPWHITLNDTVHPLCCPGCEAVAHAIVEGGLESYYLQRTELPERPANDALDSAAWAHFDQPERQRTFVTHEGDTGQASATLAVEGITCNACAWLIEHRLNALDGLVSSAVNMTHHRLTVSWQPDQLKISRLMAELAAIGYNSLPFTPDPDQTRLQNKKRLTAKRLTIAATSLGGIVLLNFYRPMDGVEASGGRADILLAWLSLALVSAVMFTAKPFFHQVFVDLKRGRFGPMLPAGIALFGAYLASIYSVILHAGESYAGFIALLTTFLLLGRYIKLRHVLKEALHSRLPVSATRIEGDARSERILPLSELMTGDLIVVKAGQRLPVDGTIVQGESSLNEAILTGEPLPVTRKVGDHVLCGCQNLENPLTIKVMQIGSHTRIARINAQVKAAWCEQPLAEIDSRKIHRWVVCVLLGTAAMAAIGWRLGPTQTLDGALAMLVVGSPFALALAAPAGLLAGYQQLRRRGVVVTHPDALLCLAQTNHPASASIAACPEVIVLSPRSSRLEEAVYIARLAKRCTRQNQCIALAASLMLLSLAALGYLPLWGAVVGTAVSLLAVLGNTQRLSGLPFFKPGAIYES
ncbi:heavy metal translocating P-type ATPase metal-binding domain-containing protein [Vreelandella populi]|uniref:Heavy metal translocating P-type ATPase n=1 Tax=Vreelandella populi TaxID=2498858 RepID=A0A433L925_9GAMM|nr:heavy metal translocating P-type ATPase metal-binding domain-containing protein [Halomonas populi]RUR36902.1 heavy metal translocating P-type ATPase [Halomonas populi]RUR44127.1 heavy metal translocating P-type ATPase [Halomonas populi]